MSLAYRKNILLKWNTFIFDKEETRGLVLFCGLIISYLITALILITAFPDTSITPFAAALSYFSYASRNGSLLLMIFVPCYLVWLLKKSKDSDSVLDYLKQSGTLTPQYAIKTLLSGFIGFSGFAIFMFSYAAIKTRIPEIMPYQWDEFFMKFDRFLFLGQDPWKLFEWAYAYPAMIGKLDLVYDLWAPVMVTTFLFQFLRKSGEIHDRLRFPIALIITWFIGGNLLAILFASGGPCYYAELTGLTDIYATQFEQLNLIHSTTELRSLTYQDILWKTYESPSLGLGGISAMPSMHCATSFLLVLLAWKRPILRYITSIFFLIIFCASFILGWHYAVDGLFAIPVALFGWWGAKKLLSLHFI